MRALIESVRITGLLNIKRVIMMRNKTINITIIIYKLIVSRFIFQINPIYNYISLKRGYDI